MTDLANSQVFNVDPGVLIQGITGRTGRRHAGLMLEYGTPIVGGTSARGDVAEVLGKPVFTTMAEAVRATGATTSVAFVPATGILDALIEAGEAGIRLIVTVAEGMPVRDASKAHLYAREKGMAWIGPSTPGFAIPGQRIKVGFLPDVCLVPGRIGVVAKSGTLSYEACHRLVRVGLGQSIWIGVGGETVKGLRFADLVPYFQADDQTDMLVVIGEIGGSEEEELAATIAARNFSKPCFALVAGSQAPEGKTMGHAGALAHGVHGTFEAKAAALRGVGASVFSSIDDLIQEVSRHAKTSERTTR